MCSDLVAKDKDIVILRTFSKIYGMAGLRAGAALGRPDLLKKMEMDREPGNRDFTGLRLANVYVSHHGADNGYGDVDQSVVLDTLRLAD